MRYKDGKLQKEVKSPSLKQSLLSNHNYVIIEVSQVKVSDFEGIWER